VKEVVMEVKKHLITSVDDEDYQFLLKTLHKTGTITVDVETTGLDYIDDEVIGVGFAVFDHAFYVDLVIFSPEDVDRFWEDVGPYFVRGDKTWIAHNAPFDLYFIRRELYNRYPNFEACDLETDTLGEWWDSMSMATLVDESLVGVTVPIKQPDGSTVWAGALSLKALSKYYLGRTQKVWNKGFAKDWTQEERGEYGMDDVINTYDLAYTLHSRLKAIPIKENNNYTMWDYYRKVVAPQTYVVESMERYGFRIDAKKMKTIAKEAEEKVHEAGQRLKEIVPPQREFKYGLRGEWTRKEFIKLAEEKQWPLPLTKAGNPSVRASVLEDLAKEYADEWDWDQVREVEKIPFDPASPLQLGEYLEDIGVQLPHTEKTGQPSTNETALEKARETHPDLEVWQPLERYKKLSKLQSTYIEPLLELAWEDGSIHPEWNSSGTVTGRYSSSKSSLNKQLNHKRGPALQTIPNPEHGDTEYNPREWFIAREGYKLIVMDLSQAEVRMMAVRSGCPVLRHSILSGEDIHSSNAAIMFGREWEEAEAREDAEALKHMRSVAKTMTFGIMYGMGPSSLANLLGISYSEARDYLDRYYETFHGIAKWKNEIKLKILRKKYSTSIGGRRRRPTVLRSSPVINALESENPKEYARQRFTELVFNRCWDKAIEKSKTLNRDSNPDELDARGVRQCINFAIQASVGDLINHAAAGLVKAGYRVIAQMHDELILEVEDNPDTIQSAIDKAKELLEINIKGITFKLDCKVGDTWGIGKEA
jgi:DNA polymerase I-like protein with 3'-5' exonuclease and polymerase domains